MVFDGMDEVRISEHSCGMVGGKEVVLLFGYPHLSLKSASDKRERERLSPERATKVDSLGE